MVEKSKTEEIIELVNKFFTFTDEQQWDLLLSKVFTETIVFDMSSLGGEPAAKIPARQIADNWKHSFQGIDSVYHQSGNFVVSIRDAGHAEVRCYSIAVHYKASARKGSTRDFFGTYDIVCVFTDEGWRISGLKYNLKFIRGNQTLE